jgi:hypothetical protein
MIFGYRSIDAGRGRVDARCVGSPWCHTQRVRADVWRSGYGAGVPAVGDWRLAVTRVGG